MSYDVDLCDPVSGKVLETDEAHQIRGGTYRVGGSSELSLNITYNYGPRIYSVLEGGIPGLEGKTGAETLPLLKSAAEKLRNDTSENYWEATEGNAKRAILGLVAFATMRPDGVWRVS